jgi:hypothetical protein
MSMSRDEALALLGQYIKNERMINHCLASEAVMRALARRLGRDEEKSGAWRDCCTTWMWSSAAPISTSTVSRRRGS